MTTAEHLEWVRRAAREHECDQRGHTTTTLNDSTFAETSVTAVCDCCEWTVSAGGPREKAPPVLTLAEFLLARIAEDEAVAQEIEHGFDYDLRAQEHRGAEERGLEWIGGEQWADAYRLAIPSARVLAECEAKRRIVDLHAGQDSIVEWFDAPDTGHSDVCPSCHPAEPTHWNPPIGKAGVRPQGFVASYVLAPCLTLRMLALPYADHPEYDESWRP